MRNLIVGAAAGATAVVGGVAAVLAAINRYGLSGEKPTGCPKCEMRAHRTHQ
jgi:hypothetical protein